MSDRATDVEANLLNDDPTIINPATEEKQDDIIENQTDGSQKTQITDGADDAAVVENTDDDTNLDNTNGLVVNGIQYYRINATEVKPARMDASTHSVQTIDYAHHEIHSGSHFIYRCYSSIAKAGVKEFLIVTPAGTSWAHMVTGFDITTSLTVVEWFEDVATSNDGVLANTKNRNRNVADNNTTLVYEDPTVTGGAVAGNLIQCGIFGAGRGSAGGGARDNEEVLLAPSTKYLVRFTEQNLTATNINFFADWYEHTDKD